ncbi:helix-turn-helix domain-containing protein [Dellaglioa sp. BT-FLS60]
MNFIFNKDDIRKLQLFSFLESSYAQTATIKEIKTALEWSTFITTTAATELEKDIAEYDLESYYTIIFENKAISLQKSGRDSINHLIYVYATNSANFKLLNNILMTDANHFDIDAFAESIFLSTSKTYRIKYALDDALTDLGLSIDSDFKMAGPEEKIRMFYYQIYLEVYKNYEFPFSDAIDAESNKLFNQIMPLIKTIPTHTQILKLKFMFAILLQRLSFNHSIKTSDVFLQPLANPDLAKEIEAVLKDHDLTAHLSACDQHAEAEFIINFLYSEELISAEICEPALKQKITTLNNSFLTELNSFFNTELSEKIKSQIFSGLSAINFQHFYKVPLYFSWNTVVNDTILNENYNWFYLFVDDFIKKDTDTIAHLIDLTKSNESTNLKSNYIFLLIRFLETASVVKPVTVTIDFSAGRNYNELIYKSLKALPFFNINVNFRLSKDTDIYLSDFLLADVDSHYLIWGAPPLATDWETFANVLVAVRSNSGSGDPNDEKEH